MKNIVKSYMKSGVPDARIQVWCKEQDSKQWDDLDAQTTGHLFPEFRDPGRRARVPT